MGLRVHTHITDLNDFLQHVITKSGSLELMQKSIKNMVAQESTIANSHCIIKNMLDVTDRLNKQADDNIASVQNIGQIVNTMECTLAIMVGFYFMYT